MHNRPEPIERLLLLEVGHSQAAMVRSVRMMKSEFRTGFRPKVIARSHPWVVAGTAAAAGFAVASSIVSLFRKRPAPNAAASASPVSPTGGLAAIGLATIARLLTSPSVAALPTVMGTLFNLWQANSQRSSSRTDDSSGHRS